MAKRQRGEPAAVRGRPGALGQLVKDSFPNNGDPGESEIGAGMRNIGGRHRHFAAPDPDLRLCARFARRYKPFAQEDGVILSAFVV
jgi:hypothetical protein